LSFGASRFPYVELTNNMAKAHLLLRFNRAISEANFFNHDRNQPLEKPQ
jgi:hypothetical protein